MNTISVVIAAYNEEGVILSTAKRLLEYMKDNFSQEWEIIFVDDGSDDNTGSLLEQAKALDNRIKVMTHPRNFGQGKALRTGFDEAMFDIIVTLDADLSYGPEYIGRLTEALEKNNVEISLASAYMEGGSISNVPFHRYVLSKVANRYLAAMSHYNISTSTCAIRAYKREVLDSLFLSSEGMELQLEVLMKAALTGFRVCEIPADLSWPDTKTMSAGAQRTSKMQIPKTVGLYLKLGWLSRPAIGFLIIGAMIFSVGLYWSVVLSVKTSMAIFTSAAPSFVEAISVEISQMYSQYTYSFVLCGGLLIFGFQFIVFGLIFLQNKYYYDDIYKIMQDSYIRTRQHNKRLK